MLPDFDEFLRPVKEHLRTLGIGYEQRVTLPLVESWFEEAEQQIGFSLPSTIKDLYRAWGDGAVFQWESDDSLIGSIDVCLKWPSLFELAEARRPYLNSWMYSCDFVDFHVQSPIVARNSAARMMAFLPLFVEPNGDAICLDCTTEQIVLDQHDWFDHGSGENGFLMANNLEEFLDGWKSVCFTIPKSGYWRSALNAAGVSWTSDCFPEQFIIG